MSVVYTNNNFINKPKLLSNDISKNIRRSESYSQNSSISQKREYHSKSYNYNNKNINNSFNSNHNNTSSMNNYQSLNNFSSSELNNVKTIIRETLSTHDEEDFTNYLTIGMFIFIIIKFR